MQDKVLLWRIAQLARAGYNSECAIELAMANDVDLHVANDLPRRGCSSRSRREERSMPP